VGAVEVRVQTLFKKMGSAVVLVEELLAMVVMLGQERLGKATTAVTQLTCLQVLAAEVQEL
jgi:hypothetical protein